MDSKKESKACCAPSKQTKDDNDGLGLDRLQVSSSSEVAEAKTSSYSADKYEKNSKETVREEKQRILEKELVEEADAEFEALLRLPNTGKVEVNSHPRAREILAGFSM